MFFWIQHQYQSPVRVKEITPLDSYNRPQQNITLLSESSAKERRSSVSPLAAENGCLFLGGFDDRLPAEALEQRLLSWTYSLKYRGGYSQWRGLLGVSASWRRQASLRQLRELQSRNIDSYIITVGDLANGISLGIFSRKDSAEGVVARLRGGLCGAGSRVAENAPQVPGARRGRQPWSAGRCNVAGVEERHAGLQHRQMPCAGVATSE